MTSERETDATPEHDASGPPGYVTRALWETVWCPYHNPGGQLTVKVVDGRGQWFRRIIHEEPIADPRRLDAR